MGVVIKAELEEKLTNMATDPLVAKGILDMKECRTYACFAHAVQSLSPHSGDTRTRGSCSSACQASVTRTSLRWRSR